MKGREVPNPQNEPYKRLLITRASKSRDEANWRMITEGEAVAALLTCWNVGSDIDARSKVPFDVLQGIIYENDSQIKAMHVRDKLDWNGPRIEFAFRQIDPPVKPTKARTIRFSDLTTDTLREVAEATSAIIDPSPGLIIPVIARDIPISWRTRATKVLKGGTT